MTLRSRLAFGFVAIAVILVGPLVFAIRSLHQAHETTRALQRSEFAASLVLGQLRESLNDVRRQELAVLFTKSAQARDALAAQVHQVSVLADSLNRFQLPTPARDIASAVQQIAAAAPEEDRAVLSGRPHLADSISDALFTPALTRADSAVSFAEHALRVRTAERVDQAARRISSMQTLAVGSLLLALALAAVIAWWLTRSISSPVYELERGMRAVADGELDHRLRVSPDRRDEFGRLAESFQEMTRQLGELDKLKAEFVSVASHELKTPINVIIGYLQLLEEGVYGQLPEKHAQILKTVGMQAQSLLRLVKQLLDVSRFEAGGGRIEPRPVSLPKIVTELEQTFRVLGVQRGVEFVVEAGDDLPAEVNWDVDRVNEVLGNLLSNAFKFTPRGGRVTLRIDAGGDRVSMAVADTGAGIPPAQLPRIFEKFYQADNQRSASALGSGLGLAIAKQIVEAHGGTIQCDSTLGVGTTFTITLPVRVARRTSAQRVAKVA